jgi:hypothetical protein
VKDERVAEYCGRHENWINECRKYLNEIHITAQRCEPPLIVAFQLANEGTRPAAQTLLEFFAEGDVELIAASAIKQSTGKLPVPPKAPRGAWRDESAEALASARSRYDPLAAYAAPRDFSSHLPVMPNPHDPDAFYWKGGRSPVPKDYLALTCDNWRHGIEPHVVRLCVSLPWSVGTFAGGIQVVAHAENLSYPARFNLPITVEAAATSVEDLAVRLVEESENSP